MVCYLQAKSTHVVVCALLVLETTGCIFLPDSPSGSLGSGSSTNRPDSQPNISSVSPSDLPRRVEIQPIPNSNLVGTWRGKVRYKEQSEWVYAFNEDDTFTSKTLYKQGQVGKGSSGRYTFANGSVVINWPSTEEKASLSWVNADEFLYVISSHTDQEQVGLGVIFRRSVPIPDSPAASTEGSGVSSPAPASTEGNGSDPNTSSVEQEMLQKQQNSYQQQEQMRQQQQQWQQQQQQRQQQEQQTNEDHFRREESGDLQPPRY
jgi:hypothetical protein